MSPASSTKITEGSPFHFVAEVQDVNDDVVAVRLLVDSQVISDANVSSTTLDRYSMTWSDTVEGNHTVSIEALDGSGNSLALQTGVFEVKPKPSYLHVPSVIARLPAAEVNGTMITTTSEIYFTTQVNDVDGNVSQLQFYIDGKAYESPVVFEQNASFGSGLYTALKSGNHPIPGTYSVHSVASDPEGNLAMSEIHQIIVVPGASTPSVSWKNPPSSTTIRAIRSGTRQATGVPIIRRQFFNNRRDVIAVAILDPGQVMSLRPKSASTARVTEQEQLQLLILIALLLVTVR